MAAFLKHTDLRLQEEGEAEIDSEAGNAVRIMTVHKSKGLEFPVVIVPDLQRKFNSHSQLGIFVRGSGMGLKLPDAQGKLQESGQFRRIAGVDTALERAELKRVLYVAMTRAEKQLILSTVAKSPKTAKTMQKASGWLDWARELFGLPNEVKAWPTEKQLGAACLKIIRGPVAEPIVAAPPTQPMMAHASQYAGELSAAVRRNIAAIRAGNTRPVVLSPAYLAEYAACPRSYYYSHIAHLPDLSGITDAGRPASSKAAPEVTAQMLGITFHRFLELTTGYATGPSTLEQALQETVPLFLREEAGHLIQPWVEKYISSHLHAKICSAVEERREWPFQYRLLPESAELPVVWLSGQVDRVLFYLDGTLGIVDYKTDRVIAGELQKKAARYRLQLAGYALAAGAVFGRNIGDAQLYFARTGETADIDAGASALLESRQELQAMAGFIRSHDRETDYPCRMETCNYCKFLAICSRN